MFQTRMAGSSYINAFTKTAKECNLSLDSILQSMGDAFVSFNRDWRYTYVNDNALRLMDKSHNELIGKTLWEVFPDTVGTVFDREYHKAMDENKSVSFQTFYLPYNVWLEIRAYPNDEGISIFYTDITARKLAEQKSQESEHRLKQAEKIAHIGHYEVDLLTGEVTWSDEVYRIYGLSPGITVPAEDVRRRMVLPEDRKILDLFETSVKEGNKFHANYRIKRPDGTIRNLHTVGQKIDLSSAGKGIKFYGTINDITDYVKAQRILTDSEKWFRNVANNSPVMIWGTDEHKNYNYCNNTWLQFTGRTLEQELGSGWTELIHPDDIASCLQIYNNAFDARRSFKKEYRLLYHDNEYRWVQNVGKPLFDPDGTFKGYIGTCSDINDQYVINDVLEKRVQQRTMELTAALEREKELNEMKSRFVSIASHEFRTPLSTILSSVSLIDSYSILGNVDKQKKHIDRIKLAVRTLTDILSDFLSLEKLEQGKIKVDRDLFDLNEFTRETIEELEMMVKNGQPIHYSHHGANMIFLDRKILHGILLNLLSNAIKYSDKEILITTEVNESNIRISVTDKGIGIPEIEQRYLFTKFYRANNVGNVQGTGLGLNIVQRYVELLDGTIEFISKVADGTTFTVQLPHSAASA